ncbi:MAG: D-erythronate dehydrogenase [Armatimonadota bacterium]
MKMLVTGAAGFLGTMLVERLHALSPNDSIVAVDTHAAGAPIPGTTRLAIDIASPGEIARVVETHGPFERVWHLAAVVSGTAEADFDLGWRVNWDGTRFLLDALRGQAERLGIVARLAFTSSVAVFGGDLPEVVDDRTVATPQWSYGMQKLACEILIGDHTRKSFVDGRAIRLPTISVRPGAPNGALSSFASGIVREPMAGLPADLPVPDDTALWLLSPDAAVDALVRTNTLGADDFHGGIHGRGLNLPGLTVTVAEMLEALRTVAGDDAVARVRRVRDPRVEAVVGQWPARFRTDRADALGYRADTDFTDIVRRHAARIVANDSRPE